MNENIGENTLNENDQELSGEGEVKIREPKPVEDNHIEQEGADSLSRLWNFAVSGKSIEKTPIADMEMAIKYIHDLDATVTKAAIRKGNYDLLMISNLLYAAALFDVFRIFDDKIHDMPYLQQKGSLTEYSIFQISLDSGEILSDLLDFISYAKFDKEDVFCTFKEKLEGANEETIQEFLNGIKAAIASSDAFTISAGIRLTKMSFPILSPIESRGSMLVKSEEEITKTINSLDFARLIIGICEQESETSGAITIALASQAVSYFNINPSKIVESWRMHGDHRTSQTMVDCFDSMLRLDQSTEGAVEILAESYGIRNFERIPVEIIEKQLNFEKKEDRKYTLVVSAVCDHNRAYSHLQDVWVGLDKDATTQGVDLVFIEVESLEELEDRLGKIIKPGDEITNLIINAHGTAYGLRLGHYEINFERTNEVVNEFQSHSTKKDRQSFRKLLGLFPIGNLSVNATLLLNGCSMGSRPNSLGKQAPSIIHRRVLSFGGETISGAINLSPTGELTVQAHDGSEVIEVLPSNKRLNPQ